MSVAVCGKRASSFFEDQQLPHAASPPPASTAAPPRRAAAAPTPRSSPQSAPGILDDKELSPPVETVPCSEWVEVLMNEMASASNMDYAKAHASRVLEVFEKSMTSRIGAEAHQNFQKEKLVYKEQFEAVIRENTIKKAVAIQHERQKEHDERSQELQQLKQLVVQYQKQVRSQELQQLKQLVVQYQEQVRSLEVNNYALSMHLWQAQQGSSIPGHFNRDIF